jgi:hypothetical protein
VLRVNVRADSDPESDVPIGERVLMGNGPGTDYSDSHGIRLIIMRVH